MTDTQIQLAQRKMENVDESHDLGLRSACGKFW
jgi:hypothetical protein